MKWLPVGALVVATLAAGCGSDTALLVDVDLSEFAVPAEVDSVHLELLDGDTLIIGRTFVAVDDHPLYEITPGPRTPTTFTLVACAYLGEQWVSQSDALPTRFSEGAVEEVALVVPRP